MKVWLKSFLIVSAAVLSSTAHAQVNRYFVFFKDKANTPYSISSPSTFLTQKSILRRQKQDVLITDEDLPVNPLYVQQVKATGAATFFTSKWWNGVLVQTDNATLTTIKALPFVLKTELVAPGSKLLGGRMSTADKSNATSADPQPTDFQLQQLALDKMQEEGYRGEGVDVAQFDSGWLGVNAAAPFQHLFQEGRMKAVFNFVKNTKDVYTDDNHGTEVLSVMGAFSPGAFTGGVYKANFYLFQTEDKLTEYRIEEYNWTFAAERADSLGVDVINSSLGYYDFDDATMNYKVTDLTGDKAVVSISARKAVEKGIVVVCSAGNEGNNSWRYVSVPADVDGVIAVGSITQSGSRSLFSSFGPSADGRIKPEVVALGSGTSCINQSGTITSVNGTSLASPLIASLAAGLIQAFPSASGKDIYDAILNSGTQSDKPDNILGYGVPRFTIVSSYLKYGAQKDPISVFPNPVSNEDLNVLLKEPTSEPIAVSIYDVLGKRVAEDSPALIWDTNPRQFDLSQLPTGIYFLVLRNRTTNLVVKLAKSN
jgi:serine protease AprX